jgi:hypothetical protein
LRREVIRVVVLFVQGLKLFGCRFCAGWIVVTVEVSGYRQAGMKSGPTEAIGSILAGDREAKMDILE